MKTILVPLDGSALAEQALGYARMLAPLVSARVRLLHVVTDVDTANPLAYDISTLYSLGEVVAAQRERYHQSWQTMREHAEGYLASQAIQFKDEGIDVDIDVHFGSPPEVIGEVARSREVTLIVMATHGYSGLRRWALGSVTDRVVQASEIPVLVVRGAESAKAAPSLRHIMVPLDGSEFARQALPLAIELATCARAELSLFEAVVPLAESNSTRPIDRYLAQGEELLSTRRMVAESAMAAEARNIAGPDLAARAIVVDGYAAEAIVDEAAREHADLIVMATHGRGGLSRWALGSVADKVLHATTTPLLLVRATETT
jgi:nucleotide-binding universal stress UspA family protein